MKYEKLGVLLVDKDGDVSVQLYEDPLNGLNQFDNWRGNAAEKMRATYLCLDYSGEETEVKVLMKELPQSPVKETAWRLGEGPIDLTKVKFLKHPFKWVRKFLGRIFRG